jgi:hypothetical protein
MNTFSKEQWINFQKAGLLWWVNRGIMLFGWVIAFRYDDKDNLISVYPERTMWRGFDSKAEGEGFTRLTGHIAQTAKELVEETKL